MSQAGLATTPLPSRSSRELLAPSLQRWVRFVLMANVVLLPFEDALLALLAVPAQAVPLLRLGSEASLYLTFLIVLAARLQSGRWRSSPFELVIAIFALPVVVSVLAFGSDPLSGAFALRTLLRYATALFLALHLPHDARLIRRILRAVVVIGVFQSIVIALQYTVGAPFTTMFLPRVGTVELLGAGRTFGALNEGGVKVGAVLGTFTTPAAMATFMMMALIVNLAFAFSRERLTPKLLDLLFAALALFAIFASLKRSALALALLTPLLVLWLMRRRQGLGMVVSIYAAVAILGGSLAADFLTNEFEFVRSRAARSERQGLATYFGTILSRAYWERSSSGSRLWFIVQGGGFLIDPTRGRNWIGYGPGDDEAREAVIALDDRLERLRRYDASKDVFWVTLLLHYGLAATAIFLAVLISIYRRALWLMRRSDGSTHILAATLATVLLLSLLYGFVERIFLIRTFAFYLWLLAGLTLRAASDRRHGPLVGR